MGCPYSRTVGTGTVGWGEDSACLHTAADLATTTNDNSLGGYGRVVNDVAGPPAFSAEQRRIIKDTWARMSPTSTAIGKQVLASAHLSSNDPSPPGTAGRFVLRLHA